MREVISESANDLFSSVILSHLLNFLLCFWELPLSYIDHKMSPDWFSELFLINFEYLNGRLQLYLWKPLCFSIFK